MKKLLSKVIFMIDAPKLALFDAEKELQCKVEQLLTPLTRRRLHKPEELFCIDNGAFAGFQKQKFLNLLKLHFENRANCRFLCVPDVWANARRTGELFEHWQPELCHWKLAFAIQDGQGDLPIYWQNFDAIFVGGSDRFRASNDLKDIIKTARALDKWIHIGRINTPAKFEYFERLGVHSVDGTGLAQYSKMRFKISDKKQRPRLFAEEIAGDLPEETIETGEAIN